MLPDSTTAAVSIDSMEERHWDSVRSIYQAGIDTGHATFAASPPASREVWQRDHLNEFSVVAIEGKTVVGWASLAPVSGRCVYSGVAEVSVYVDPAAAGRGVGTQVLAALWLRRISPGCLSASRTPRIKRRCASFSKRMERGNPRALLICPRAYLIASR